MNKFYFSINDFCIFISCIFIWNSGVLGLRCHCDFHCPDDHENFTCITKYKCFATVEMEEGTDKMERKYGCMPPEHEGGMFQCRTKDVQYEIPMKVECCNDEDLCNEALEPMLPEEEVKTYIKKISAPTNTNNNVDHTNGIALVISVTVCAMLLVIAVTYFYLRYRQITSKRRQDSERKVFILNGTSRVESVGELLDTTGTGSGVPRLHQRTIAKELKFHQEIGSGRFATVYKGRWRDQYVAIKVVKPYDEKSWQRELEIFQTAYMCHENILGFIASDIMDNTANQEIQRLIITDYQPYGSLYDFLLAHSFDYRILFRLAYSAISGLSYIHRVVTGSREKPAIAHRDITSKNILVKENLQCCIGDLGLAVKYDSENNDISFNDNPRLPSVRYMSPEILQKPDLICYTFETYQKADIYAFGLVLWEITRRYEVAGYPEEYQLPFSQYVGDIPTLKEMYDVVILNKISLKLPVRYEHDQHGKVLVKLMNECWHYSPLARLTALYVKKTLQKSLQDQDSEESVGSSTGTASTGVT